MSNLKIYVKTILIPLIIGGFVGLLTTISNNYDTLRQPSFAPPNILFPIVWFILYVLMGISDGILKSKKINDKATNQIYIIQLFVNYLWSFIFFTFELRFVAFLWILLLIVLVIIMIYRFYNKNKIAGVLQIPYLLWIMFAAYLNWFLYYLNR